MAGQISDSAPIVYPKKPDMSVSSGTRGGISIVPRRISGLNRTESGEMGVLNKVFLATRPPDDYLEELQDMVEHVFVFSPKLVRDMCSKNNYREVEIHLYKKTHKAINYLRRSGSAREEGGDDSEVEPQTRAKLRENSGSGRGSDSNSDDVGINWPMITTWLNDFLFMLWYSSLKSGQEEIIPSIRQSCKQIVWRATGSKAVRDEKKKSSWSWLRKMLPWQLRLLTGETGPMGESSWGELQYDPFDRDRMKTYINAKRQAALHWFTREFEDPNLEKSFEVDYASRLMKNSYWPFFLVVALSLAYVTVKYGMISGEYPSITVMRLLLTEPIIWLIVAAIIQVVMQTVVFDDHETFIEHFFFYQLIFAVIIYLIAAVWMYEARQIFVFVAWPINEGFTMSFILICISFLFYIRFVFLVGLTAVAVIITVILRYTVTSSSDLMLADFSLMQGISILVAILVVLAGRYIFETHTRLDFVMTRTLFAESERSDRLLRNILPEQVIQHLKQFDKQGSSSASPEDRIAKRGSRASLSDSKSFDPRLGNQAILGGVIQTIGIAEAYERATVLFTDVCSFTAYSSQTPPEDVVMFLNDMFTCFDDIAEETGLEKIKTIGDAYMAVCGLDQAYSATHAVAAVRMGLKIGELLRSGQFRDHNNLPHGVRIGVHSGPCVAGIIGRKKFIYDVWGDTVNTASRMESTGERNMVHVSETTAKLLEEQAPGQFEMTLRGEIEVKGKGNMTTYFVLREKDYISSVQESPGPLTSDN